jgi:hypothetical protein
MNHPEKQNSIDYLLFCLLEGSLDAEGTEYIESWLAAGPENRKYYCEFAKDYAAIKMQVNAMISADESDNRCPDAFDREAWRALSEMEKVADVVEISKMPAEEYIQTAPIETKSHPINKTSLITAIVSIAALIAMIAFVNLYPEISKEPTATLVDAIQAQWGNSYNPKIGDRLFTRDGTLYLQQGIAKIQFDNGANIILEAPGRFELTGKDQIDLQSGKLFASVPKEAIGFTVNIENTRIIDLGTEFGIDAREDETLELHVLKGKTMMIAGLQSNKKSMEVAAGNARKVFGAAKTIADIVCNDHLFVRKIDSAKGFVWRGQKTLNLADVVGGGDGLGSGRIGRGIDLSNGKCTSDFKGSGRSEKPVYISVSELIFVDGVFVPDAGKEAVQVTSQGNVFKECPQTSGDYFDGIRNGGMVVKIDKDVIPMELNGQRYGTLQHPALYMHANAGITFDLNAIRDAMPGFNVEVFRTYCGISANNETIEISKADIFVLVDGRLRTSASITKDPMTAANIEIKLTKTDRFLTLISTDGGNGIGSDWVMFTKPYLFFKPME